MGYGDKLMAIGDAWNQYQHDPRKRRVAIGNGKKIDQTDADLNWGLDFLATQAEVDRGAAVSWVISYPGWRPYHDHAVMRAELRRRHAGSLFGFLRSNHPDKLEHFIFNMNYRATPAPIRLTDEEQAIAERWAREPFIAIEPYIKAKAPPSKQWPVERFAEVARRLSRDFKLYQIGAPDAPPLGDLPRIRPRSFREGMAYLKAARLFIGPEGGLHHASAAMGTRAVVIYGGYTSPQVTGYDFHVNLTGGNVQACGVKRGFCAHCQAALDNISIEEVESQARRLLA
ncbi:MAG: CcrColossus [Nevskia sp.]|nr:CcrColossus [Nevskia sp.]